MWLKAACALYMGLRGSEKPQGHKAPLSYRVMTDAFAMALQKAPPRSRLRSFEARDTRVHAHCLVSSTVGVKSGGEPPHSINGGTHCAHITARR